ncbi:MAG: DUF370 domain-containing protein [Firmicutes bacterium]|jgi:hypothetical protein|nr:DUF370 domain-containing protein [Bacillota bacterium]
MYLHIGQDWMIAYPDIIGLFNRHILDVSPDFRHLFSRLRSEERVFGSLDTAKTLILTDRAIYLSPISTQTLQRRVERRELFFDS